MTNIQKPSRALFTKEGRFPYLILILQLLAFLAFNWEHFDLPHYWDEAWVYAPAIKNMAEGIPSPMPGSLELGLSRGHPLLFQFLGGIFLKMFGSSNIAAHAFAFLISSTLIVVFFEIIKRFSNAYWAILGTSLLLLQSVFLAQAQMLYPEVLLSLGLLISLYGYVENRNWIFYLGVFVMVFSKESSVVFITAFLCWDLWSLLFGKMKIKSAKRSVLAVFIFLLHPLSLKLYYGWFFFPEHTSLINLSVDDSMFQIRQIFKFIFEDQGRGWLVYPALIIGILAIRFKGFWWNLAILFIGFSAYKILLIKWVVPHSIFPVVMFLICLLPLFLWRFFQKNDSEKKFSKLYGPIYLMVIGFVVFSSINFLTFRYLMPVIIIVVLASTLLLSKISNLNQKLSFLGVLILISPLYYSLNDDKPGETNLGIFKDLQIHQEALSWFENEYRDENVCGTFVMHDYLTNYYAGYLNHVPYEMPNDKLCDGCEANFMIISSMGTDCESFDVPSDFGLIFDLEDGKSFVKIFKRN
jgi:hypothetical protein